MSRIFSAKPMRRYGENELKKLWERYGNYIIAAAFAVVLAVAAYRGYEWWQARRAAAAGAAYDAAEQLAQQGKHDEAEAAFCQHLDR